MLAGVPLNGAVPNVGGVVAKQVTESSAEQYLNAELPMEVSVEGKTTLANDEQLWNEVLLIDVTPGMLMLVNDVQLLNVFVPIVVTPDGMSMLVSEEHSRNAEASMEVSVEGKSILVRPVQP